MLSTWTISFKAFDPFHSSKVFDKWVNMRGRVLYLVLCLDPWGRVWSVRLRVFDAVLVKWRDLDPWEKGEFIIKEAENYFLFDCLLFSSSTHPCLLQSIASFLASLVLLNSGILWIVRCEFEKAETNRVGFDNGGKGRWQG